MLAKITAKNQLTLPKAVTNAVGPTQYFEVEARDGQIILTPAEKQIAVQKLREAFAEHERQKAAAALPQATEGMR